MENYLKTLEIWQKSMGAKPRPKSIEETFREYHESVQTSPKNDSEKS